jgi:hypothetical protein
MLLDVFKSDAFHFTKLVAAINKVPYAPTRLGDLGLFTPEGVSTTTVAIEMQDGKLTLVPTAPRGARGPAKNLERRVLRDFRPVHLPQTAAVMADEVQGLRAYGTDSEEETAMRYLQKKLVVPRRDLDITHEYQRMGALKGQVIDADGTTVIYNYFTEFGVTQSTASVALATETKLLQWVTALKRQVEDKLGGVAMSGLRVLCSSEFFDKLTANPAVVESYKYQMSVMLRTDVRKGFEWGGVIWEEYRGSVGGQRFIAANKAHAIPEGVPDLFKTFYAPAPYMETVNTEGLPFYMKGRTLEYDTGIEYQIQSNPLHMNTRPEAVFELTTS